MQTFWNASLEALRAEFDSRAAEVAEADLRDRADLGGMKPPSRKSKCSPQERRQIQAEIEALLSAYCETGTLPLPQRRAPLLRLLHDRIVLCRDLAGVLAGLPDTFATQVTRSPEGMLAALRRWLLLDAWKSESGRLLCRG